MQNPLRANFKQPPGGSPDLVFAAVGGELDGIEGAPGSVTVVTKTDGGVGFRDGRTFWRLQAAKGDGLSYQAGSRRCLVRQNALDNRWRMLPGDHSFRALRFLLDAGFEDGGELWVFPIECHGTGGVSGNWGIRFYEGGGIEIALNAGTISGGRASHSVTRGAIAGRQWKPGISEMIVEEVTSGGADGLLRVWLRDPGQRGDPGLIYEEAGPTVQVIDGKTGAGYDALGFYGREHDTPPVITYLERFSRWDSWAEALADLDATSDSGSTPPPPPPPPDPDDDTIAALQQQVAQLQAQVAQAEQTVEALRIDLQGECDRRLEAERRIGAFAAALADLTVA